MEMATIKEWEKDLKSKSTEQMWELARAMETLSDWPMFTREFEGFSHLKTIVDSDLKYNRYW
jgi:hypothetical protein